MDVKGKANPCTLLAIFLLFPSQTNAFLKSKCWSNIIIGNKLAKC